MLSLLFLTILEDFIICTEILIPGIFKNIHAAKE